jgi:serine/threonine protein kinase
MAEEKHSDFRIETVIGKDGLHAAFERFAQLARLFDQLELNLLQLQGQHSNLRHESNAQIVDAAQENLETNRIRHAFLAELEAFKAALPQYLNTTQPEMLLRGVNDQLLIVVEVMGQRLRGYYDIERSLGDGNSALIFLLKDVFTNRRVVAKVLKVPVLSQAIKEEIRAVSQLKHRNIIKLLGESLDRFPFYILCEYVNGPTLPEILAISGPLPPEQVVEWLLQLADALSYLRQKRILHSNVRPSKIYVDEEQHLMISPFDIIKAGMTDRTLGKFREDCQYLSPEYLRGDDELFSFQTMRASDQFSIGLVAYKMLTGNDLFEGKSVLGIITERSRFFGDKNYRRQRLALVGNAELARIMEKMLQENPAQRFEDLHELQSLLKKWSAQGTTEPNPLRASYWRCLSQNRAFVHEFYAQFLQGLPAEQRGHFGNIERQHTMFQMAANVLIDLEHKKHLLHQITGDKRHRGYDLATFERFLDTFIETARKTDHKNWNSTLEQAWNDMKQAVLAEIQR